MVVTACGMLIDVRLLQFWKANHPMLVTPSGMVIEVRLKQFWKANHSMLVTGKPSILLGMTSSPSAASLQPIIAT